MQVNNADQTKHQRRNAGLIHEPKLNWDQVNEIRRTYVMRSRTHGLKALAERYGVSANNIHKIVYGKTWKVLEGDDNTPPPMANKITPQKFNSALTRYLRRMHTHHIERVRLLRS